MFLHTVPNPPLICPNPSPHHISWYITFALFSEISGWNSYKWNTIGLSSRVKYWSLDTVPVWTLYLEAGSSDRGLAIPTGTLWSPICTPLAKPLHKLFNSEQERQEHRFWNSYIWIIVLNFIQPSLCCHDSNYFLPNSRQWQAHP